MSKQKSKKEPKKEKPGGPPPDSRALENTLADIGRLMNEQKFSSIEEARAYLDHLMASGELIEPADSLSPLRQAQELVYDAWEEVDSEQRIKLAKEALAISEDCADAYVLLAEESATSLEEEKELYETAVQAGERALGSEAFTKYAGHFWGFIESRPYMRARAGLAECLWDLGQRNEAVAHYQEMLALNPSDNQGLRYFLLTCLFEEGLINDAEDLLQAYKGEISADWKFTRALLLYHKDNTSRKALYQLTKAVNYNPHVAEYLLGKRHLPRQLPHSLGFGDESEAASYVIESGHLWLQEVGAIEWLRRSVK